MQSFNHLMEAETHLKCSLHRYTEYNKLIRLVKGKKKVEKSVNEH